ncbi:LysM peptidoglycan-binding domain-containing protein [Halieaceae bacterium IMCC14734]|uniref:LysM peptidoglycan-binding domain-containing protein n=1 Tax=Candidatus Litorirhabdus singularis TaxID=2518993 RepID=A0ABT3TJF6_9GAMM|nr:peptidoglycan DD-metalloendopeptidase family protein [Candidatus Litorirhabdus singularis]MCX2982129.1 LysM peptidoglycan-binding domain-containing protein [Candidatus Litorirhabdus singularis]
MVDRPAVGTPADREHLRRMRVSALLALSILLALLSGCGTPPRAPVEDRTGGERAANSSVPTKYSVRHGDTLYGIAWRYGLDHKQLASNNAIAYPYTIFPGQSLRLKGKVSAASTSKTTSKSNSAPRKTASAPSTSTSTTPSNSKPAAAPAAKVGRWRWPSQGKVVRGFSGEVHKGIDIAGKAGDAVQAVAAGKVVYAGNGIVGYGNLLIIKHNETYLSAYGHNRRLRVAEGASVKAGERIADMGSSATNSVKLHFEIRRDGKPIDPLKFLPKQS